MFKKIIIFALVFSSYLSLFVSPAFAQTTDWSDRCAPTVNGVQVATIQGLECLFANVLRVIMYLVGLFFLFMFISNAFKYLFSGSDQKQLAQINSSFTMAVVGLVGVIISWLIIKFIADFTGVDVINFKIPS